MTRWFMCVIVTLLLGTVAAVACGGGDGATDAGEPDSGAPQKGVSPPTPTPGGTFELPSHKLPEGVPVQPTLEATAPAAEGAIVPDAIRGGILFTSSIGCSGCHSTGTDTIVGPGLAGLKGRAKDRISQISAAPRGGSATDEGTLRNLLFTAEDYAESSIRDSQRYIVPGFEAVAMPAFPDLSQQDVADLVAYVLSLN